MARLSFTIALSPLTLSNLSPFVLVPLLRYPLPLFHPVYERILDPPVLTFSLFTTPTPVFMYSP